MGILSLLFGCKKPHVRPVAESESSGYEFSEPRNTACITCRHVVKDGADILHVTHDAEDGGWQFLCGGDHTEEDAMILGMEEIVRVDPSVNGLHQMPEGVGASRETRAGEWKPFKLQ